jgi:multiple antibiotic resistance protein
MLAVVGIARGAWGQSPGEASTAFLVEFLSIKQIFLYLFVTLGPLKVVGPFARLTAGADDPFRQKLAVRAFGLSCAAIVVAGLLGERLMTNWGVSTAALLLTGGVILFLVALNGVLEQYKPEKPTPDATPPTMAVAFAPLTFPTIVTPYGLAVLIVILTLVPPLQWTVFALALLVLALDLLAMLFAKQILTFLQLPLQLLGAVLGIVQVALGVQIVLAGLRLLRVLPLA